jgi:hypothetical protein
MPDFLKLFKQVTELDVAQQDELITRIKAFRSVGGNGISSGVAESDESFVLRCLTEFMNRRGDNVTFGLMQRWATPQLATGGLLREKIPGLMAFLSKQHSQRSGRRALLMIGIELLYIDLEKSWSVPVTAPALMSRLHFLPRIFDKHFPGYAQAGLLHLIVEAR